MFAHRSYNVAPIPGDNSGGGGGGDGPSADGGLPIGSVISYAGATAPPHWLICNGTEYPLSAYNDLFRLIGFSYGPTPSSTTLAVGQYVSYNTGEIGFASISNNPFVKVGMIVIPTNFRVDVGPNFNGVPIIVEYAPAIGGTGTWGGRTAIVGQGSGRGNVGFTANVNRGSFATPDLRSANPVGVNGGTIALGSSGGSATTTITDDNLPQHKHGILGASGEGFTSFSSNGVGYGNSGSIASTLGSQTKTDATIYSTSNVLATNSAISTRNPYVGMNYIIKAKI